MVSYLGKEQTITWTPINGLENQPFEDVNFLLNMGIFQQVMLIFGVVFHPTSNIPWLEGPTL